MIRHTASITSVMHHRYCHLTQAGKRPTGANVAIAGELAAFVWADMTDQPLGVECPRSAGPLSMAFCLFQDRSDSTATTSSPATTASDLPLRRCIQSPLA
jgi:hypothetical protein